MYKILSFDIGNSPERERESYDKIEATLNEMANDGFRVISTCWDDGGLQGGQASGLVVVLEKK